MSTYKHYVKTNNEPALYIRHIHYKWYNLTFLKSGKIRLTLTEKRFSLPSKDRFISRLARSAGAAVIKTKKMKNASTLDRLYESRLVDNEYKGVSIEDCYNESLLAILSYNKSEYTPLFRIAFNGTNRMIKRIQNESVKNAELAENMQAATKSDSVPDTPERNMIKAEKLKYVFSHLSKEEQKLFRVYSETLKTYRNADGKMCHKHASLSTFRKYMNYPDTMDRSTIGKRIKRMINHVRQLMIDYNNLSKNLLSVADNIDSGDIIRRTRKIAVKADLVKSLKRLHRNEEYVQRMNNTFIDRFTYNLPYIIRDNMKTLVAENAKRYKTVQRANAKNITSVYNPFK